jgi:hypothetical protein
MHQYSYKATLTDDVVDNLKELVGLELFQLHAINEGHFNATLDEYSGAAYYFFKSTAYAMFRKSGHECSACLEFATEHLGDTWAGYDICSLVIKKQEENIVTWDDIVSSPNSFSIQTHGEIISIDIYGIQTTLNRQENGRTLKVDVDLDIALVFTTKNRNKIVFVGNRGHNGLYLNYYPKFALGSFEYWINNYRNQWNEKLLLLKQHISGI